MLMINQVKLKLHVLLCSWLHILSNICDVDSFGAQMSMFVWYLSNKSNTSCCHYIYFQVCG